MAHFDHFWAKHQRRLIMLFGIFLGVSLLAWALQAHLTEPIDSFASCVADGNPVTDSDPQICRYGGHAFVGPTGPQADTAVTAENLIPFKILVDGDSLGSYPKREEVITTQVRWQQYWREVHASLPAVPALLPVNFTQNNVLAVSEGVQPSKGYIYKITGVVSPGGGTDVAVKESIPTAACKAAQAPSNRYFIVQTPKLAVPVSFHLTSETRLCH